MLPDNELRISLGAAVKYVQRTYGKRLNHSTIFRWARHGLRGGRVRLGYTKLGRDIYTSTEACERFFAQLAADDQSDRTSDYPVTNAAHDAATKRVEAAGL